MHPYERVPDRAFWSRAVSNRHVSTMTELFDGMGSLEGATIATAGSCFAQHIGRALRGRGLGYLDLEPPPAFLTEDEAKKQGVSVQKAVFPWAASGRAIANGRDEGLTKLLFDSESGRIVGGAMVGTHAGDMIGELCLAIEMGCDAEDIGKTIHPHPTLGESIGMAAEVALGSCTDLPPTRRR